MFTASQLDAALAYLVARGHIKPGTTLVEVLEHHKMRALVVSCAKQQAQQRERLASRLHQRTQQHPDFKLRALPPVDRE